MGRVTKALKLIWRGANALSTIQWLWGLLPAGVVGLITGLAASAAHLPPVVIAVLVLGAASFAYLIYVGFRIERMQRRPDLAERVRDRSLARKADMIADLWSGPPSRHEEQASEAFRKNELARKRERARLDKDPAQWVSLSQALHYLVYETAWSAAQPAVSSEEEFNRVVTGEARERLARGEIAARGQLGWDEQSKQRATEPIRADYWVDSFFLPYAAIALGENCGNEVCKRGGGGAVYRGVIVRLEDVKRAWPATLSAWDQLPPLAAFVEEARARIAGEGIRPSDRSILSARDEESAGRFAKRLERTERAAAAASKPGSRSRLLKRDATLAEAMGWAVHGDWDKPFHGNMATAAFAAGLGIVPDVHRLLSRFTSLAREGKLTVWGKRDDPGYYEQIPEDHWQASTLEIGDIFGGVVTSGDNPYRSLMLNKAQVERQWPHEG